MGKQPPEMLFGVHPVLEALRAGKRRVFSLFLAKSRQGEAATLAENAALERGITIKRVDEDFFRSLPPGHQGIAARTSPLPEAALEEILEQAALSGKPLFIVFCDGIEDPRNLGAIVRTALCAGVHGVVVPNRRSAPLSPVVSKASAGALEHLPVAVVPNLVRAMEVAKKAGAWVWGAAADAPASYWDADLAGPLAIVIGGEGSGLGRLVRERCDQVLSIPQSGPVTTLNASVAGALLFYEVLRQRRAVKL
ncbi:MAG: 23S rRNA (guanosine(2251)-2'-O)-methyltransferase RlmB [Desulfatibacillaceae bacterium]|nr:23S rRNA (guanosine(2251)-2'-O)-methyltransferase RlmB [Desulfatibacillaceae bacterium]